MEHEESHVTKKLPTAQSIVKSSWSFYKKNFKNMWPLFLLGGIGEAGFSGQMSGRVGDSVGQLAAGSSVSTAFIITATAFAILLSIFFFISKIALYKAISDEHKGEFHGVKSSYKKAMKLFWSVVLISIIAGFAILGGFFLLIVPGIILSGYIVFALYELYDENKRGFKAITGSWTIVKGRWWKTLGKIVLTSLIMFLYVLAAAVIPVVLILLSVFVFEFSTLTNIVIGTIVGIPFFLAVVMVFQPLSVIIFFKIYHALKETKIESHHLVLDQERKRKIVACIVISVLATIPIFFAIQTAIHHSQKAEAEQMANLFPGATLLSNDHYRSEGGRFEMNLPSGWYLASDSPIADTGLTQSTTFVSTGDSVITVNRLDTKVVRATAAGLSDTDIAQGLLNVTMAGTADKFTAAGFENVKMSEVETVKLSSTMGYLKEGAGRMAGDNVVYHFATFVIFEGESGYQIISVWPESEYGVTDFSIENSLKTLKTF